jgi:hypothetical protein
MEKNGNSKRIKTYIKYFELTSSVITATGVILYFCGIRSGLAIMAVGMIFVIYSSNWLIKELNKNMEKLEKQVDEIQCRDKDG